jgi:NAD(P)H-dependent flavin oxidoreductase YrpB (nitropropane dioxygenase family)
LSKLRTPICDLLGIEVPIVLAGMGGASGPELAAAVSNAGGLGVLGAAACGPDELREWIARTRKLTDCPFGVDTLLPASVRRGAFNKPAAKGKTPQELLPEYMDFAREFMEREGLKPAPRPLMRGGFTNDLFDAQMKVVIEERVPVYASGLGDPAPWMEAMHANGTRVMAVVGAVRHARKVAASGIDVIVAQGHDAGGHNSPVGTMALIPQVVDAAGAIPVLGAGGIVDGRGVAAALMLGAQGVWVGSAFLATHEANIAEFQKKAIVESSEEGTTITRSVTGKPARYIKSKWTQAWVDAGIEPLPMPYQGAVSGPVQAAALRQDRGDIAPGFAGQGIGMITSIRPAREVLRDLVEGAERALGAASRFVR